MPNHITFQNHTYIKNDHFDGECPKCGEWEAPITTEELTLLELPKRIHIGSTEKVRDRYTVYPRNKWRELFRCPRCGTRFSVEFSDI